jgi:glycosyltransferase involved in cell wall biosynthesis
MKICLVNTYHYRRGGDSTYTFDLAALLESRGHDVVHFAMKHPKNFESPFEPFFVDHIDYREIFMTGGPVAKIRAFLRSLYSSEAKRKFAALLDETYPDIIHLQNFRRHLTFSILPEAVKRNIPVVFTAHDYDPICPNSLLFASREVCEVCAGGHYYRALGVRCKEDSFVGTVPIVLEGTFTKWRRYYRHIDTIITPSDFLRNKLIEYGFDAGKVVTVNNFIDASAYQPAYGGNGFIYYGRLATEKGLESLIEAACRVPETAVMIAGDGPIRESLEQLCLKLGCRNVEFLGYVERGELLGIVRGTGGVVMPSVWYENFPYSVLEAFALGKPVIASSMGGMPEMVKEGETGSLFGAGDALALSAKMKYFHTNVDAVEKMGRNARRMVETEFNADVHYEKMMEVYAGVTT